MVKNLLEKVSRIHLKGGIIKEHAFNNYQERANASSDSSDCCYGADCGDCDCGGYCIDPD